MSAEASKKDDAVTSGGTSTKTTNSAKVVTVGCSRFTVAWVSLVALGLTSCPHLASRYASSRTSVRPDSGSSHDAAHGTIARDGAGLEESPLTARRATEDPRQPAKVEPARGEDRPVEADAARGTPSGDGRPTAVEEQLADTREDTPAAAETRIPGTDEDASTRVEPRLFAIGRETWIFAEPSFESRRIGYLRFGAEVHRSERAVSRRGCSGGWYQVQPGGYACANGRTSTTDPQNPLVATEFDRVDRASALPYAYAVARRGVPKYYGYLPSPSERPLAGSSARFGSAMPTLYRQEVPGWLRGPHEIFGYRRPRDAAYLNDGLFGAGIALLGLFRDSGNLYGITPDLELVTTDALEPVRGSDFVGKAFGANETLPVAFVMTGAAWIHSGHPERGTLRPVRHLARREIVSLGTERVRTRGVEWLETKDGQWVRAAGLRIVETRPDWPDWARDDAVWVDVSIERQTLVAYEGRTAVYATLVSTGVDGLADPKTTKSTKTGVFHVVSKHLSATMNGEDEEGAYEMRDVPWVQYFSEGYALHGAYWHDAFGQPRSHGCINLSPKDARWLFHFTNPGVPKNWHGVIPEESSATVYVHP